MLKLSTQEQNLISEEKSFGFGYSCARDQRGSKLIAVPAHNPTWMVAGS